VPIFLFPLYQVGKLGPVCSVACGRFYTAVALEPYTGPSAVQMQQKVRARAEKKEAVARAKREREAINEREDKRKRDARRRELIAYLNANYPGCKACATPFNCAGFVADAVRPTACVLCGHERDSHGLMRKFDDEELTNEMLEDFADTVRFTEERFKPPP